MNLSQLYYFRTLTQVKSYKKAAAELFISEPTLSVAIKKLESELGTELLERKRHSITLTADGEEFAECVELSLSNLDAHVESIKRRSQERNRMLRIGIVFSAQQRIWAPLINQFWLAEGEDPNSVIRQGTTGQLIRALKHGEVDVFIAGQYPEDPDLVHYPMWYSNVLAAINVENPLSRQESVTFDDIRKYSLISYTLNGPVGDDTKKLIDEFNLTGDFSYPNEPSLCSNVAANPDTIALVCDSWLAFGFDKVAIVPISDAPKVYHQFWLAEGEDPNSVIRQGTTGQLIRALKHGEVDVFIAGQYPEDPDLVHYPMWYSNVLAAINVENPLSRQESVTFDDIRKYSIISYTLNGPVGDDTKKLIDEFDLTGDFSYPNEPSLCSNVAANPDTIALVCDSWLAFGFDKVAIVPISDAPKVYHQFWLTHLAALPKGDSLLRRFIDFAINYDFDSCPCDFVGKELNTL